MTTFRDIQCAGLLSGLGGEIMLVFGLRYELNKEGVPPVWIWGVHDLLGIFGFGI